MGVEGRDSALALDAAKILIADDHPLVRGALRLAVEGALPKVHILEAEDFKTLSHVLHDNGNVDLVMLDLTMPGIEGFSGLIFLRAQFPAVPVVVVSAHDDHDVMRRCIDFGASGFVPKTSDIETMRTAVRAVLGGQQWVPADLDLKAHADHTTADVVRRLRTLTPQQVRVLMMLSEGLLNKQIAYELSVSEATVKAHVSAILQKLGVESRTQAVIAAKQIEKVPWTDPALSAQS